MKAYAAILFVTLEGLACSSASTGLAPTIVTGDRLRELAQASGTVGPFSAANWVTLRGNPLPYLSPPFGGASVLQNPSNDGLNVWAAFAEGKTAALVIAEVWENIPQVWLQPWYIQVTAFDPSNPGSKRLSGSMAIVDISENSLFYSPYWEIIYVVVPPGTASDHYQSAKQLFRDNLEMHRAYTPLLATYAPSDLQTAVAEGASFPVRPFSGDRVGAPGIGNIWLDGAAISDGLYPGSGFTWNSIGVIDESSLFVFAVNGSNGPTILGIPSVIGPGPLKSEVAPRFTAAGLPIFGALTRPYLTYLPPSAGVFVPSNRPALKTYLTSLGVQVPNNDPAIEALSNVNDYVGRVTLNPSCLASISNFPACQWLDSQHAVENSISAVSIVRQEILFTSPIVFYNGQRVGR